MAATKSKGKAAVPKLRHCPFCGSDGECLENEGYGVRCLGCGARGPDHDTCDQFPHPNYDDAQAWNTRIDDQPGESAAFELDAKIAEAEEALAALRKARSPQSTTNHQPPTTN